MNYKINEKIDAKFVRVIDDDGKNLGKMNKTDAIRLAREQDKDLVQVSGDFRDSVCKIVDYGKLLYSEKKKNKQKHNHSISHLKEIRVGFNISDHDLKTKNNQVKKMLLKGDRVRYVLKLKGFRGKDLKEIFDRMNAFLKDLEEVASWVPPVQNANTITTILSSK